MAQNYSTVPGFDSINVFELDIRTSKLTKTSHYNSYQHKLYRLTKR